MTVIIVLDPNTRQSQLDRVIDLAASAGADLRVHSGSLLSLAGKREVVAAALTLESSVLNVADIPASYPMAAIESRLGEVSTVRVGNQVIGGDSFTVMAGPCSVETSEQMFEIASTVRDAGCHVLRGGAFKPRTSPYAFQGLGIDGLKLLAEARAITGLPVVTEVLDIRDLDAIAAHADMLQVGARNMQNYALLREIGRLRIPVLLKRGLAATIDEMLLAAEYILDGGNDQVALCERGIRTFEQSYRFTLDLTAIPVLRERTHLPVIVDPSHAAGVSERVIPLALAAAAVGADGIIVETHHDPASALCDGQQALPADQLGDLMERLQLAASAAGRVLRPAADARPKVGAADGIGIRPTVDATA